MNYAERRALAAKRLANPELYLNKQSTPQAEHQPKPQPQKDISEAQEARLIDRGLITWWE